MNKDLGQPHWSENVILVDGDYVDKVAFNLTVNFERMLGRRIPKADMARWIDCIALDGGVRAGVNSVQVVFIHSPKTKAMDNFAPGDYASDLDGKAFGDHLGEFLLSSVVAEGVTGGVPELFTEAIGMVCSAAEVKRAMLVPNAEEYWDDVRNALHRTAIDDKAVTVFAMEPLLGGHFRQEILGYSLMSALGIKAEEIKCG